MRWQEAGLAAALLLLLALFVREAAQTTGALEALSDRAQEISRAESESNHLWARQFTTDEWEGVDGWRHSISSERRTDVPLREWLDAHNRLVDEKIASKPLAYAPREQR